MRADSKRGFENESFLSSLIDNIPNMIFVKDAETLCFVRINRAGEKLLGLTREQLIGKNDFDFFPPAQAEFFTKKDREVLDGRKELFIQEEEITVPGGSRTLQTRKIPLFAADGKALYLLGISEDITEKKEAQAQYEKLKEAISARKNAELHAKRYAFYDAINKSLTLSLNVSEAMSSVCDTLLKEYGLEVRIDTFNLETQSAVRHSKNGIETYLYNDLSWLKSDFEKSSLKILDAAEARSHFESAGIPVPRDFKLQTAIAPLILRGRLYGVIFLYETIEHTLLETSLGDLNEILPRIALALENSSLFAKAQAASQAKSDFLANISHEVRTPLGAIIGFAELAQEKAEPGSFIADSLATITRNSSQLLALVNDLLDLSKIESKKMDIEKVQFSLTNLLSDIKAVLEMKAKQKGIQIETDLRELDHDEFISDPLRLRQILLNLFSNAIKFTDNGKIQLVVRQTRISSEPDSKFKLEFEIADTGIGMSPIQQKRLFSAFQQADSSVTRRYGGTGLGLFLSRKLAQALDGDLSLLYSEPNKGSRFLLSLEVATADSSSLRPVNSILRPVEAHEIGPERRRPNHSNGRDELVLVVDDSPENRVLMDAYLKRLSVPHEFAENGKAALEKMFCKNYSTVLMDVQMPEMDGMTAVRIAREKGYKGSIVALTAHAMKGDREKCIAQGFDEYLCKPVSRKTLEAFLKPPQNPIH